MNSSAPEILSCIQHPVSRVHFVLFIVNDLIDGSAFGDNKDMIVVVKDISGACHYDLAVWRLNGNNVDPIALAHINFKDALAVPFTRRRYFIH